MFGKKSQPPINHESMGTTTMPNGSRRMCGTGLSVTWPPRAAVSSPSFSALQAWADSWQMVEKRKTPYQRRPSAKLGVIAARLRPAAAGWEGKSRGRPRTLPWTGRRKG